MVETKKGLIIVLLSVLLSICCVQLFYIVVLKESFTEKNNQINYDAIETTGDTLNAESGDTYSSPTEETNLDSNEFCSEDNEDCENEIHIINEDTQIEDEEMEETIQIEPEFIGPTKPENNETNDDEPKSLG